MMMSLCLSLPVAASSQGGALALGLVGGSGIVPVAFLPAFVRGCTMMRG